MNGAADADAGGVRFSGLKRISAPRIGFELLELLELALNCSYILIKMGEITKGGKNTFSP